MEHKTRFVVISICVFLLAVLIALFIKMNFFTVSTVEHHNSEIVYEYMMKEVSGKIGIYKDNQLIRILDVYIANLPQYDANQIVTGIQIKNEEELQRLIEAFDS